VNVKIGFNIYNNWKVITTQLTGRVR